MRYIEFSNYLQATHFPLDGTLHTMGCCQYITIVDQAASTVDYELSHRWRMLRREEALADPSNHMLGYFAYHPYTQAVPSIQSHLSAYRCHCISYLPGSWVRRQAHEAAG